MSAAGTTVSTSSGPQHAADSAKQQATGFAGILQSARNSINRNTEVFSEGLHKGVGGSTGGESGYETDSEASVTEVGHTPQILTA